MRNISIIQAVDSIYVTDNVAYVTITGLPMGEGVLPKLFGKISEANISLDLITQIVAHTNKMGVSFSLKDEDFMKLSPILKELRSSYKDLVITANTGNTKISVFGQHINDYAGVAQALFRILEECGVEPKVISTSEKDISILITEMNEDEIIVKIRQEFDLPNA